MHSEATGLFGCYGTLIRTYKLFCPTGWGNTVAALPADLVFAFRPSLYEQAVAVSGVALLYGLRLGGGFGHHGELTVCVAVAVEGFNVEITYYGKLRFATAAFAAGGSDAHGAGFMQENGFGAACGAAAVVGGFVAQAQGLAAGGRECGGRLARCAAAATERAVQAAGLKDADYMAGLDGIDLDCFVV